MVKSATPLFQFTMGLALASLSLDIPCHAEYFESDTLPDFSLLTISIPVVCMSGKLYSFYTNVVHQYPKASSTKTYEHNLPDYWPRGYKTFSCSTQLSTKFILLINVKMSTIVGILTFISVINTTSERLKARIFFICRYFSFI